MITRYLFISALLLLLGGHLISRNYIWRCNREMECPENDTATYLRETKAFIQCITDSLRPRTPFPLLDQVAPFNFNECKQCVANDTIAFTQEERNCIQQQVDHPWLHRWTNELVPGAQILKADTEKASFAVKEKDALSFYKHIRHSFSTFSAPVFIRNYSYCIFSTDHHCGWLCGGGEMALYKKEDGRWKKVKTYYYWIS